MKTGILRKCFVLMLALLLLAGVLAFPVFADSTETETAETTEQSDPYVVFWAQQMRDAEMLSDPHQSSYSFYESDGLTLLGLDAAEGSNDPYVSFTPGDYSADEYPYVTVFARAELPGTGSVFTLFYDTEGTDLSGFRGSSKVSAKYARLSGWQILTYDFSDREDWTGNIEKLRFDFFEGGNAPYAEGTHCDVAAVVFSKTVDDIYASAYEVMETIYPPVQVLSEFYGGGYSIRG